MADRTKYYYLKIKENFFDTEDMKLLESMEDGYLYSNILMKMYLLSLKNNGKLMYKDKIPYNSKMLSTILNHNVGVIEKAVEIFKELTLIEILDSGAIFMLDIQNYIGKSSDEADRKREYRKSIESEKILLMDKCPDKCPTNCSNIKDRVKDKDIIKDITTTNIDIYTYIESNFGILISGSNFEKVSCWLKEYEIDMLKYAVDICVANGKRTIKYLEGILKNWKGLNYVSLVDVKEKENIKLKKGVPEWFDKDYENKSVTNEEKNILENILKNY